MYSEEIIENYIKWAGFINEKYGIFTFTTHFLLVTLSIIFIERAFSNPGRRTTIALSILLWIINIFGGIFFFLGKEFMGIESSWQSLSGWFIIGGFLIGGLFALPAFISKHQYKLSSNPVHRIIGLLFMVYGAALYPLLEIVTGLDYPGIVLFGAECPTFIFVIGLLIASLPSINKIFFGILLAYSLISSFSAVRLGVWVDIGYLVASISGIILYIIEIIRIRKKA